MCGAPTLPSMLIRPQGAGHNPNGLCAFNLLLLMCCQVKAHVGGGRMLNSTDELILKIYDAVANPDGWQPALDQLVDMAGAHGSIVFEWADHNGEQTLTAPMHSGRYPRSMVEYYLSQFSHLEAQDQTIIRAHTQDHDGVELLDDTLLADTIEDLKQQAHVQLLSNFGIFHRAAGVMNKDNKWISLFSIQLSAARDRLTDDERQTLSRVLPHLAKALDLGIPTRQLQNRYKSVLAAMDHLTVGLCVLDKRGMVVARNQEFQRQQDAHRTFRISSDGRLLLTDSDGQKRLTDLMAHTENHGKFGARPRKESVLSDGDDVLCIEISPLHHADELGSVPLDGFIISSSDTSLPLTCNTARVQDAFGLTPAEAELIEPICQGRTNPEIADRRGRSVATINAQTKSILSKTNCANRTQLVRMMMRFGSSFLIET